MTGWRPEDDETVALRIPPGPPGSPTDPLGPTRHTVGDPRFADGTLHTVTRPDAAAPPEFDEPRAGARTTDPASTMRLAAVFPPDAAPPADTAVPPADTILPPADTAAPPAGGGRGGRRPGGGGAAGGGRGGRRRVTHRPGGSRRRR
ncbi:hypothetical protein ABZW39_22850, partial [Streptomyces sp. NPDC005012]